MSTNSKIGRRYHSIAAIHSSRIPLPKGPFPAPPEYAPRENYPDGTGPCGKVCSCGDYCKAGELGVIDLPSEVQFRQESQGFFPS